MHEGATAAYCAVVLWAVGHNGSPLLRPIAATVSLRGMLRRSLDHRCQLQLLWRAPQPAGRSHKRAAAVSGQGRTLMQAWLRGARRAHWSRLMSFFSSSPALCRTCGAQRRGHTCQRPAVMAGDSSGDASGHGCVGEVRPCHHASCPRKMVSRSLRQQALHRKHTQ